MSSDILDQIDHVLADYETGPDAMRWTPEGQPERGPQVTLSGTDITEYVRWECALPGAPPHVEWLRRLNDALASVELVSIRGYQVDPETAAWIQRACPEPLAVDGVAYRRRQKARRRRNR